MGTKVTRRDALKVFSLLGLSSAAACAPKLSDSPGGGTEGTAIGTAMGEVLETLWTETPVPTNTPVPATATQRPTPTKQEATPTPKITFGGEELIVMGIYPDMGQDKMVNAYSPEALPSLFASLYFRSTGTEIWEKPTGITVKGVSVPWGGSARHVKEKGGMAASYTLPGILKWFGTESRGAWGAEFPYTGQPGGSLVLTNVLDSDGRHGIGVWRMKKEAARELSFDGVARNVSTEFISKKYAVGIEHTPEALEEIINLSDIRGFLTEHADKPALFMIRPMLPVHRELLDALTTGGDIYKLGIKIPDYARITVLPDDL
jgi:hypothetical protein